MFILPHDMSVISVPSSSISPRQTGLFFVTLKTLIMLENQVKSVIFVQDKPCKAKIHFVKLRTVHK